jgi:hypothetical protein
MWAMFRERGENPRLHKERKKDQKRKKGGDDYSLLTAHLNVAVYTYKGVKFGVPLSGSATPGSLPRQFGQFFGRFVSGIF